MAKISSVIKSVDTFGESVGFTIGNGQSSYKTIPGALCSMIIYLLILIYGGTKFKTMIKRDDTRQQQ